MTLLHTGDTTRLDLLMVSEQPIWPLDQGFRVHGYHMATALAGLGVRIGVASMQALPDEAPQPLRAIAHRWPPAADDDLATLRRAWGRPLGSLRRKLAAHQALDMRRLAGLIALAARTRPQVVIALGQHGPILLRALHGRPDLKRIWYAADEPVYFHLSCLRRLPRDDGLLSAAALGEAGRRLRHVALYAALEHLFAANLDGAIGVSPRDTFLLKQFAGVKRAVTIRNGVDLDYFRPRAIPGFDLPTPKNVIFWGRMDFEPNVDAVSWFTREVWPALRHACRNAQFRIVGKNPSPRVRALERIGGIEVIGAVEDIRPWACRAMATVLPMRCGGGIKNKLLEAAAMGLPIVASPQAVRGLDFGDQRRRSRPLLVAHDAQQWASAVRRIWADPVDNRALRQGARGWVENFHAWPNAARRLIGFCAELGCQLNLEATEQSANERNETPLLRLAA